MNLAVETKECTGCHKVLPFDQFYKKGSNTDRRDCRCRICRAAEMRKYRIENPDIVKAAEKRTRRKNADKCNARAAKWYQDNKEYAKQCRAEYRRKNTDKIRCGKLRLAFGIDAKRYKEMMSEQKDCCAICGKHQSHFTRRLAVDHCHSKGHVRGLLCGPCNTGLGVFQESPEVMKQAINYLLSRQ